jgi:hypothetical protein
LFVPTLRHHSPKYFTKICAIHLFVVRYSSPRRFPPRWSVEDIDAAFVVKDHSGQKLAYVYYEDEPGRRSAAKLLSKDEGRRIAVNVAKLPEFCL